MKLLKTASRMETTCPSGFIQVTEICYYKLKDKYSFQERFVEVKGKGQMKTFIFEPGRDIETVSFEALRSDPDLSHKHSMNEEKH